MASYYGSNQVSRAGFTPSRPDISLVHPPSSSVRRIHRMDSVRYPTPTWSTRLDGAYPVVSTTSTVHFSLSFLHPTHPIISLFSFTNSVDSIAAIAVGGCPNRTRYDSRDEIHCHQMTMSFSHLLICPLLHPMVLLPCLFLHRVYVVSIHILSLPPLQVSSSTLPFRRPSILQSAPLFPSFPLPLPPPTTPTPQPDRMRQMIARLGVPKSMEEQVIVLAQVRY